METKQKLSPVNQFLFFLSLILSRGSFWLLGLIVSLLVVVGCAEPDTPATSGTNISTTNTVSGPLALRQIIPSGARAGQGFSVQPNGQSALSAISENAVPDTVVIFDGKPLISAYGGPGLVTAFVPGELTESPGSYEVYLQNGTNKSNHILFEVKP